MKSKVQAKDLRGNETAELERTLRKLQEDYSSSASSTIPIRLRTLW